MPTVSRASKKRSTASNEVHEIVQTPQAKKQRGSYDDHNQICAEKIDGKHHILIDPKLGSEARKFVLKGRYGTFPRFFDGTVYIELIELHDKYTYVFDKTTIAHSSTRLGRELASHVQEANRELAENVKKNKGVEVFLKLQFVPTINAWVLCKVPFTIAKAAEIEQPQSSKQILSATTAHSKATNLQEPITPQSPRIIDSTELLASHGTLRSPSKAVSHSAGPVHIPSINGPKTSHTPASIKEASTTSNESEIIGNEVDIMSEDRHIKQDVVECESTIKKQVNGTAMTTMEERAVKSGAVNKTDKDTVMMTIETGAMPGANINNDKSTTLANSSTDINSSKPAIKCIRYAHEGTSSNFPIEIKESNREIEAKSATTAPLGIVQAHHNIFRIFHNMAPELDTCNINTALIQIVNMIELARWYRCLPMVRHYLSNHVLQFGRDLFKAIMEDPPRWLMISIRLTCALIFKEAIIHLVGQYPQYPWTVVPYSELPQQILELIRKKVDKLRALKASIDTELFISSITVNREYVRFSNLDKSNFPTWFIVQLWRDWFCHSLCKDSVTKHGIGSPYRLIAKGGDAYLNRSSIISSLIAYKGKSFSSWDLIAVEKDMNMMKDLAKKKIKDLVVNYSMLEVEEAGIQHLTCTKVENDELLWIKPPQPL